MANDNPHWPYLTAGLVNRATWFKVNFVLFIPTVISRISPRIRVMLLSVIHVGSRRVSVLCRREDPWCLLYVNNPPSLEAGEKCLGGGYPPISHPL